MFNDVYKSGRTRIPLRRIVRDWNWSTSRLYSRSSTQDESQKNGKASERKQNFKMTNNDGLWAPRAIYKNHQNGVWSFERRKERFQSQPGWRAVALRQSRLYEKRRGWEKEAARNKNKIALVRLSAMWYSWKKVTQARNLDQNLKMWNVNYIWHNRLNRQCEWKEYLAPTYATDSERLR